MNGNSSAQLEAAEMRTLVVGKPGKVLLGGRVRGGGVRKIVGCTNSWPKAMRMLCDNNCIAEQQLRRQLGDWRLPGTAIEICFAD